MKEEMKKAALALYEASSACPEAKAAAKAFADTFGTDKEGAAWNALVAEAKEDRMPIDELIAFAGSADGKKLFGDALAAQILSHAEEIKKAGALYCDCPACTACTAIIDLA